MHLANVIEHGPPPAPPVGPHRPSPARVPGPISLPPPREAGVRRVPVGPGGNDSRLACPACAPQPRPTPSPPGWSNEISDPQTPC